MEHHFIEPPRQAGQEYSSQGVACWRAQQDYVETQPTPYPCPRVLDGDSGTYHGRRLSDAFPREDNLQGKLDSQQRIQPRGAKAGRSCVRCADASAH